MAAEDKVAKLLKLLAQFGLGVVAGAGGAGGMGGGPVNIGVSRNSGQGGWNNSFLYPVQTTHQAAPDMNKVGNSRDPEFAHGRTSDEEEQILTKLEDEFMQKNVGKIAAMPPGPARAKAMKLLNDKAREYAAQVTGDAKYFKSYLPFSYAGINADKQTRTDPVASSSWVGNARRVSPTQVEVYLGPSKNNPTGWYTYGGTPEEMERFLNCPSLGQEINHIKRGASLSLRKLW